MLHTDLIHSKELQEGEIVKYGKEWRFYGGVLFGFEILNSNKHVRAR
jgi:hypothetical protein